MSRSWLIWALALAAAILQATFLAGWQPWGVVPDLLLIVLIRIAGTASVGTTLLAALSGGLVLDLSAGGQFGLALSFAMVLVLAIAWLRRQGVVMGLGLELVTVALAGGLFGVIQIALAGGGWVTLSILISRLAQTVALDVALLLILYRPLGSVITFASRPSGMVIHEPA